MRTIQEVFISFGKPFCLNKTPFIVVNRKMKWISKLRFFETLADLISCPFQVIEILHYIVNISV